MDCSRKNGEERCILAFSYGSFFGGQADYAIYRRQEDCRVTGRGSNGVWFSLDFLIPAEEFRTMHGLLKDIHWEKRYVSVRDITDGYGWSLETEEFESSGYEAYPEDFSEVKFRILRELGRLRETYAPHADPIPFF